MDATTWDISSEAMSPSRFFLPLKWSSRVCIPVIRSLTTMLSHREVRGKLRGTGSHLATVKREQETKFIQRKTEPNDGDKYFSMPIRN